MVVVTLANVMHEYFGQTLKLTEEIMSFLRSTAENMILN